MDNFFNKLKKKKVPKITKKIIKSKTNTSDEISKIVKESYNRPKTNTNCDHFFVITDEKTFHSELGRSNSHCKHCNMSVFDRIAELIENHQTKTGNLNLTAKEKDELFHVHVWEILSDSGNEKNYHCVSAVTDWSVSDNQNQVRIKCPKILKISVS